MHAAALFYPGCIEFEVMLAIELIGRAIEVRIATPDGADHRGALAWPAALSYAGLDPADLACILIPGGDPGSVIENRDLDRLLVEADARRLPIGAICAGPLLLGKAGLLRPRSAPPTRPARRFTHGYGPAQLAFVAPYFEGGEFVNAMLVRDGNIITAKAQAFVAFGIEMARRAGALDRAPGGPDAEAARLRAFYGGGGPSTVEG